jgi:hypothetical protein
MYLKIGNKITEKDDFPNIEFFDGERTWRFQESSKGFAKTIRDYLENRFPLNPDSNDL